MNWILLFTKLAISFSVAIRWLNYYEIWKLKTENKNKTHSHKLLEQRLFFNFMELLPWNEEKRPIKETSMQHFSIKCWSNTYVHSLGMKLEEDRKKIIFSTNLKARKIALVQSIKSFLAHTRSLSCSLTSVLVVQFHSINGISISLLITELSLFFSKKKRPYTHPLPRCFSFRLKRKNVFIEKKNLFSHFFVFFWKMSQAEHKFK